jgi:hypothetical protein
MQITKGLWLDKCVGSVRRAFIFSIAVSTFVVCMWIVVPPDCGDEDQGFEVEVEEGVVDEDQVRSRLRGGARGVRRERDSMDVWRRAESSRFRSTIYLPPDVLLALPYLHLESWELQKGSNKDIRINQHMRPKQQLINTPIPSHQRLLLRRE